MLITVFEAPIILIMNPDSFYQPSALVLSTKSWHFPGFYLSSYSVCWINKFIRICEFIGIVYRVTEIWGLMLGLCECLTLKVAFLLELSKVRW